MSEALLRERRQTTNPFPSSKFKVSELELGDVVKLWDGPFGAGIVQKITENDVTIFRPYGTSHGFASDGQSGRQIIPLTGHEDCVYLLSSSTTTFEIYTRLVVR